MSAAKHLSVGEVSARSGLAVSAIHFYESKGLISSWRNESNHRRYTRDVLRKLAVIKVAQRAGVPLREILEAFKDLPHEGQISANDWHHLSEMWHADLTDRIERLTRLRDTLGKCIGCGCLSMKACTLVNPEDQLQQEGSGPRILDP